ncbi:MAG: M15 family metallopeptidase [Oscillibacter sp.]|nr:M15 family metallopeptidase [Oscillibacter sp.]
MVSRPRRLAPSRRRNRRSPLPLLLLLGLTLFTGGFLLGRAEAEGTQAACAAAGAGAGSGEPVHVLTVPGAITSGGEGNPASDGKDSAVPKDGWNLILVNGDHPLPQDFQIPALTQLRNNHAIDQRAYPALQRMMDDCRAEGLQPTICSSYRSWEKQEELFQRKVQSCLPQAGSLEEAEEQAAVWVARPGTSEHQAGLAVDIVDKSYQLLDEGQEDTAVQKWLMEHCAEYGFILRYPTEKSALTGVGYEPWHYRYVGEEAAGEIMSRGICLEEYLEDI